MAMANHLRMNNATSFLTAQAANSSMDVEAALGAIVEDYKTYLIPGTKLVDYGPAMDGFSPTYKHVMPGCSQGNNVCVTQTPAGRSGEFVGLLWLTHASRKLGGFCVVRYMLRDYAALKEAKGDAAMAADLRAQAAALAKATIDTMYTAKDGKGWFNVRCFAPAPLCCIVRSVVLQPPAEIGARALPSDRLSGRREQTNSVE